MDVTSRTGWCLPVGWQQSGIMIQIWNWATWQMKKNANVRQKTQKQRMMEYCMKLWPWRSLCWHAGCALIRLCAGITSTLCVSQHHRRCCVYKRGRGGGNTTLSFGILSYTYGAPRPWGEEEGGLVARDGREWQQMSLWLSLSCWWTSNISRLFHINSIVAWCRCSLHLLVAIEAGVDVALRKCRTDTGQRLIELTVTHQKASKIGSFICDGGSSLTLNTTTIDRICWGWR